MLPQAPRSESHVAGQSSLWKGPREHLADWGEKLPSLPPSLPTPPWLLPLLRGAEPQNSTRLTQGANDLYRRAPKDTDIVDTGNTE